MDFVKLKTLCEFDKGSTGLAKAEPGTYPLVTTGAERRTCKNFQFDTKAVCIPLVSSTGHGHASLNNVHYQEGRFALGSILVALTSQDDNRLDIQFLHLYLSQLKDQVLVPLMSGAANVALSVKKIQDIKIPLPSIDRQHEIVERFKSIVIEEDEIKSELTHQQTLLKKLRQAILQEAIQGKLTAEWRAQNPDVEPARELLKRIAAEKAQLLKDKKIKAQKPLPPITDEEKPFELPKGWEWARLGTVMLKITDGTHHSPPNAPQGDFLYITAKNIKGEGVLTSTATFVSNSIHKEIYSRCDPEFGDLLYIKDGATTGIVTINNLREPFSMLSSVALLKQPEKINSRYLLHTLRSPVFYGGMRAGMSGVAITRVTLRKLNDAIVPVPPFSEQEQLVAKLDQLLGNCDELGSQITQNQTHAEQLMQAVLKEAFSHKGEAETPAAKPKVSAHA